MKSKRPLLQSCGFFCGGGVQTNGEKKKKENKQTKKKTPRQALSEIIFGIKRR